MSNTDSERINASTVSEGSAEAGPDDDLPPGNHALEVAARRGFGPLSPLAKSVWHGQATPCVSCGQLVRRGDLRCGECGQDLSEIMLDKMRAHAGPWFVLEHIRPFPGVSLERIVRQIRRGLITETSIVRGPATDFQWRFAVETPGLCRYFGKCWRCHHQVSVADTYCPNCLSHLALERPRTLETRTEPTVAATPSLRPPPPANTPLRGSPAAMALGERTAVLRAGVQTAQAARPAPPPPTSRRPATSAIPPSHASPALQSLANALTNVQSARLDELDVDTQRRGTRGAVFGVIFVLLVLMTILLTVVSWRQRRSSVIVPSPPTPPPTSAPLAPPSTLSPAGSVHPQPSATSPAPSPTPSTSTSPTAAPPTSSPPPSSPPPGHEQPPQKP